METNRAAFGSAAATRDLARDIAALQQLTFTQALRLVNIEHTEKDKRDFIAKMERDRTISAETGANLRAHIDWNKPRE